MPKQTYKILRFDGGISNDADARDIGDNQFALLENVGVDQIGKIIVLGDIKTEEYTGFEPSLTNESGFGIKAVSTDYSGLAVGTSSQTSKDYYIAEYASGIVIGDLSEVESARYLALTGTKTNLVFYWVDGALRVYDRKNGPLTSSTFTPQWRGYIEGVMYGSDETSVNPRNKGHIWNTSSGSLSKKTTEWHGEDAQIKGCFPEEALPTAHGTAGVMVGVNLIAGNNRVAQSTNTAAADANDYVDTDVSSPTALFAFANEVCMTGTGPNNKPSAPGTASGMRWGHGLSVNEGANNKGTWCPTGSDSYQFWCTTIYDGKQESIPQLFTMYNPGAVATCENNYHDDDPVSAMSFRNGADRTAVANNIPLWVEPIIKWCDALHSTTVDWENTGDDRYIENVHYNFGGNLVSSNGEDSGNPRISGIKVYWSGSEDGFTDKWLLYEWDFAKGVKSYGSEGASGGSFKEHDYTSGHNAGSLTSADYWYQHTHACTLDSSWGFRNWDGSSLTNSGIGGSNGMIFVSPPKFIRYDAANGHSSEDTVVVDAFKAVCIANRRAWIGNVTINGKNYGDRMLKSPVNQFDKFPADANQIDVTINDGDEIVALMEFADRILQFKKDAMYIINISGAAEFLESEHKYKGVGTPGAVCKTDYGIAWVNNRGAYLYNGQNVEDILEDGGIRKIKKSDFNTFIGSDNFEKIGYNPKKRQLVIISGSSTSGAAYVYDMTTKSWTYSTSMISDVDTRSILFNKPKDGDLLILNDGSNKIERWEDSPYSTPSITILTKDIDFGEPAVKKKLHKIYITYKGNGSLITEKYRVNGDTGTNYSFDSGLSNVSTWTRAELKPADATQANGIFSCQLYLYGTAGKDFEINDITFIYRTKSIT